MEGIQSEMFKYSRDWMGKLERYTGCCYKPWEINWDFLESPHDCVVVKVNT